MFQFDRFDMHRGHSSRGWSHSRVTSGSTVFGRRISRWPGHPFLIARYPMVAAPRTKTPGARGVWQMRARTLPPVHVAQDGARLGARQLLLFASSSACAGRRERPAAADIRNRATAGPRSLDQRRWVHRLWIDAGAINPWPVPSLPTCTVRSIRNYSPSGIIARSTWTHPSRSTI